MNSKFLISIFLWFSVFTVTMPAHASVPSKSEQLTVLMDSLINPPYSGYRVFITDIKTQLKSSSNLSFSIINTGKLAIDFRDASLKDKVVLNFNPGSDILPILQNREIVLNVLFASEKKLEPGGMISNIDFGEMREYEEGEMAKQKSKKKKIKKELPFSKGKKKINKKPEEEKEEEIIFEVSSIDTLSIEAFLAQKENCADLVIDTVLLVEKRKKKATLEIHISNQGKGAAKIYEKADKDIRAIKIRTHISGTPLLSKGSIPHEIQYIENGLEGTDGELYAGESFTFNFTLDIRKMTKYQHFLILSLDTYMNFEECKRTNNRFAISMQ